ncbi:hypothetical protein ACFOZ1_14040 [Gracilibacillus marinus]|uniref:DUF4352 domain-containing protein n=1 Tax=Gracilibacillus marinus TaxID=630535 RepID=A0ABV8VWN9_9BACI
MRKTVISFFLIVTLGLVGCMQQEDEPVMNDEETPTEEGTISEGINNSGVGDASRQIEDLTLQIQKVDQEAGITVENNDLYSQLNEVIKADPKAGLPNDFSVYPHDIVYFDDNSSSVLFIGVNRLDAPIRNISFDLTFGNKSGEYIFDAEPVALTEDFIGILEKDSAVPFLIEITPEEEALFMELTEDNVELRLDNANIDLVE